MNLGDRPRIYYRDADLRVRIVERVDRAERVDLAGRVEPAVVVARLPDLRGRPPSMPFRRDEAAFRFDLTEPRHAGQNETKSILWI